MAKNVKVKGQPVGTPEGARRQGEEGESSQGRQRRGEQGSCRGRNHDRANGLIDTSSRRCRRWPLRSYLSGSPQSPASADISLSVGRAV